MFHEIFMGLRGQAPRISAIDSGHFPAVRHDIIKEFFIHGSVYRESNLLTIQQDPIYSVYYISVGSSTCFGR